VYLLCEEGAGVEVIVLKPKYGEKIIASSTDGFNLEIMVNDMGRTLQNCGEWTLSVVEGGDELFSGSICSCFNDAEEEHVIESCHLSTHFALPATGLHFECVVVCVKVVCVCVRACMRAFVFVYV